MLNKSKYGNIIAITALLSAINLLLSSSIVTAQVNNRRKKPLTKTSKISSVKKQQKNQNLFITPKNTAQTLRKVGSQDQVKLSKIKQTISVKDQVLLANTIDGKASWYGPGFDGRLTANGETYNQQEMTAAHPHLEFGTKVQVTNLVNGRSVVVRINDRGPFIGDRIIDLSAAAANALNMITSGVAPVRLTILGQ